MICVILSYLVFHVSKDVVFHEHVFPFSLSTVEIRALIIPSLQNHFAIHHNLGEDTSLHTDISSAHRSTLVPILMSMFEELALLEVTSTSAKGKGMWLRSQGPRR